MESPALAGARAPSLSPTSPVSIRSYGGGQNGGPKRKRSIGGQMTADSSPDSMDDQDTPDHGDKKRQSGLKRERQPGVKRACNDVSISVSPSSPCLLLSSGGRCRDPVCALAPTGDSFQLVPSKMLTEGL